MVELAAERSGGTATMTAGPAPQADQGDLRWVVENAERIERVLLDAEGTCDMLELRLDPVLAPASPLSELAKMSDRPSRSPLAEQLSSIADRVAALAARQAGIVVRLEV